YDIYTGIIESKREMREKWKSYFQGWTDAPLTFAVVSIDRYDAWAGRYPSADRSLLKFALANVVAELFAPDWRAACADFGKDKLAMLLQPKGEAPLRAEACREAVDVVRRMLGFSVSLGIGTPQAD